MTKATHQHERIEGIAAPIAIANLDTDQIMPKQFLKRIERSGFGPFTFFDWREPTMNTVLS